MHLLLQNNYFPHHAQLIMKSTDVIENTRTSESNPEPRHTQRRLREASSILGRGNNASRVHIVGSRTYDRVPGPIWIWIRVHPNNHIVIRRLGPERDGVRRHWVQVSPLHRIPNPDDRRSPQEAQY